jgi:hypothetical protein
MVDTPLLTPGGPPRADDCQPTARFCVWYGFPEASHQRISCPAGRNQCRVNRCPARILPIVRLLATTMKTGLSSDYKEFSRLSKAASPQVMFNSQASSQGPVGKAAPEIVHPT